jgi:adenine-specific DNA-methyltransferase
MYLPFMTIKPSVEELLALCVGLGARTVGGWSKREEELCKGLPPTTDYEILQAREAARRGEDLLGDTFSKVLSAEQRRPLGAVYTPKQIVSAMLSWASRHSRPERVIDPGTGSARFLIGAGKTFPASKLIGIEFDPVAAIMARANLATAGLAERSRVIVCDYRESPIKPIEGQSLYIGNPPYVRHHLIDGTWKKWLHETARKMNCSASSLAGLHAHFILATADFAERGDIGIFITSAEWLDVNYGKLIRELFLEHLGGACLHVLEPTALPFPGTATTAVITGFRVGTRPKNITLNRIATLDNLGSLETGWQVRRERLENAYRWTPLTRTPVEKRLDFIELGELCRVHRGQVTGANSVWIAGGQSNGLPASVLFPSVTKARELFRSQGVLSDTYELRNVIDIPVDIDAFEGEERKSINRYLTYAKLAGAHRGYIARHRKAWWSVGLREPAPILASYMARRPPIFVRNIAAARHINIAHGLYPREPMSELILNLLAQFLSRSVSLSEGRTYAGGLTKFEPREMERLMVPHPDVLSSSILIEELDK